MGWTQEGNGTRRSIVWDEDNHIQSIADSSTGSLQAGQTQTYQYDHQGSRVIKRGPQGETAYVNPWFTVRNRSIGSKHVYAGTSRIATQLVPGVKPVGNPSSTSSSPSSNIASVARSLAPALQALRSTGSSSTTTTSSTTSTTTTTIPPGILRGTGLAQRSATAALHARNLMQNPHYASSPTGTPTTSTSPADNFLYYYHPDHLGSSSYVSDASGQVFEHLQYFPFGETWVQESSNTQRTPYLFTGKELDEETGQVLPALLSGESILCRQVRPLA